MRSGFDAVGNVEQQFAAESSDESEAQILVDDRGTLIWINEPARAIMCQGDGLELHQGCLRAQERPSADRLEDAIQTVIGNAHCPNRAVSVSRPSGKREWLVMIAKGHWRSALPRMPIAAGVIRIIDQETGASSKAATFWVELFGFTPAEVRLAKALVCSDSGLKECAAALGVGHTTARAQLARIFDKTGVRTQAQLLRLLTLIDR